MSTMFGTYPTPLGPLRRLSEFLEGPEIWIKRDDLTGLALGGNKTRKLEHLLAEAIASGADTVITAGAQQSNHCRLTAAACAVAGLSCHLVLGGAAPAVPNGNFLLDRLLGATIHWTGAERKGESLPRIADELRRQGRRTYVVPYGGSNAVGARGFVDAVAELKQQSRTQSIRFDRIVFASSSGGTHAGMLAGARFHGFPGRLVGVVIDKDEAGGKPFAGHIAEIANDLKQFCPFAGEITPADVILDSTCAGAGYGVVGEAEREAIRLLASLEGILLDPVYTARAMGGLIGMIRRGEIRGHETIVFWHTGGTPALFSQAAEVDVTGKNG